MKPTWEVLSIDITREVNRIPRAQLVLLDGDPSKQKFEISDSGVFDPGKEIEINLRYEGEEGEAGKDRTVFKGLVIRHRVEANQRGTQLTVDLKDVAFRMTRVRKSVVYKGESPEKGITDSKIIEKIIGEYKEGGLAIKGDAETQPEHPEIVQYYCTDWDFMLSRAQASGQLVIVEDGEISLRSIAVGDAAKHTFNVGIDEVYSFEMEADASHQYKEVQSVAWDMEKQKSTDVTEAMLDYSPPSPGDLYGYDIAPKVGAGTCKLASPVPLEQGELQAWANATLATSRMSLLRGRIEVPGSASIKLMALMEIDGVGKHFNGETLITGIRHRIDHRGWQTDVQFGLSPEWFSRHPDIMDVPAAGLLPGVNGLHIGVVDGFQEDPKKEFRVRVRLPAIAATDDKADSVVWARLASPDAGNGRGFFFRPEKGDEVVVGFFNDDPRHAVILGSLYSSEKNKPPEKLSPSDKDNISKGIVTKKGSMLRFIDKKEGNTGPGLVIQVPGSEDKPEKIQLGAFSNQASIQISDQYDNLIVMGVNGITIKTKKVLLLKNEKGHVRIGTDGHVETKGTKVTQK